METTTQRNTKIARVDGKGKILDFSDMILMSRDKRHPEQLDEGKIILSFTDYGANKVYIQHYLDVCTARVLFSDILNIPLLKTNDTIKFLEEYKSGSGASCKYPDIDKVSRKLVVSYRTKDSKGEDLKIGPVVAFDFTLTEGVIVEQGESKHKMVLPKKGVEPLARGLFMVQLSSIREAAAAILDYIRCKETAAMVSGRIPNLWLDTNTEES